MAHSLLTSQYKTTIPEEVRRNLGALPGDILSWEALGDLVQITVVKPISSPHQTLQKPGFDEPAPRWG